MEETPDPKAASLWRLLAACFLPFAVLSAYLLLTRWLTWEPPIAGDYAALIISIASGLAFIITLPSRPKLRWLWSILYFLFFGVALFIYTLWFVCAVFGDCL